MAKASSSLVPILYEDNHLLVVVKPVNIPVQEDSSGDTDLLTLLKEDIKVRYLKPGNVYLGLVHRLDRPVGGVMVFAKTSKSASRLSEMVRSRSMRKKYMAVVHGKPPLPQQRLIHYLVKDAKTNTVSAVARNHKEAKEAILDYAVVGNKEGLSLIRVDLHTGRPHQIRVQFASIRCPLFGDQKYGAAVNRAGQQIALWAVGLSFDHPTTKERLSFVSAPPAAYPWILWGEEVIASSI